MESPPADCGPSPTEASSSSALQAKGKLPAAEEKGELAGLFASEFCTELKQTTASVSCLAVFIVSYVRLVLGEVLLSAPLCAFFAVAIVGLALFALGIRHGLMPLGELVGKRLPAKGSGRLVYSSVFALGLLCTIAEPAIGSLQTAGEATDKDKAPLLAAVLDSPFALMVAVGVGVGVAAVFGTVRIALGLGIKPCVYLTCVPSIAITLFLVPQGERLPAITGLAWDCGAVTTGPVTVPIVLALGIGVAAASKKPKPQQAAANAKALEGEKPRGKSRQPKWSSSKYSKASKLDEEDEEEVEVPLSNPDDDEPDLSGSGIVTFASLLPVATVWALALVSYNAEPRAGSEESSSKATFGQLLQMASVGTLRAVVPLVGFLLYLQLRIIQEPIPNLTAMKWGMGFCFLGMLLFTIGLNGALTPLGQGAGKALVSSFEEYGDIFGAVIILVFAFSSGFVATFAEPALLALGETVEKNTRGRFGKFKLVFAVAIGVGLGIVLGMMKVLYELDLWLILTVGYTLNMVLTMFTDEVVASIAWDSAGVTTGPVTVPIVLASGLALGREAHVVEGFGILTCASIMPICAVLVSGLLAGGASSASGRAGPRASSGPAGAGVAGARIVGRGTEHGAEAPSPLEAAARGPAEERSISSELAVFS